MSEYRDRSMSQSVEMHHKALLGHSLSSIAEMYGVHSTTVLNRLRSLNYEPLDYRRSFCEDLIHSLPAGVLEKLQSKVIAYEGIHNYIKKLIIKDCS